MNQRVHPRESLYFGIAVAFSLFVYLLLAISGFGLVYLVFGGLFMLFVNGTFAGGLRGNAVRVSEKQLPDVDAISCRLATDMGMMVVPAIYVMQAGGLLNAFAMRFLGRNYVVLLADVVELARNRGEEALAFVIAHELAHHHRQHTGWKRILTLPARWIPFVGSAYSRACEYTCDAYAADLAPRGAVDGLLVLAAGKQLYQEVDPVTFMRQAEEEEGFWVTFSELVSSHPFLTKRVAAVKDRVWRMTVRLPTDRRGVAIGA